MQYDTWNEHRAERDGSTTTTETLPNLNTASDLMFLRHSEHQHFPLTTGRQATSATSLWGGFFVAFMSMPEEVLQFLNLSRPHLGCKMLSNNVYIEAPKELRLDQSQCLRLEICWHGTRGAGKASDFAVRNDIFE